MGLAFLFFSGGNMFEYFKWSRKFDCCIEYGTVERPYYAKGFGAIK